MVRVRRFTFPIMDNLCCHNLILCVELFADSMDHQRGRIITHGGQNTSNLDLIKQEHCGDAVGELGQRGIKLFKQKRFLTHIFFYTCRKCRHIDAPSEARDIVGDSSASWGFPWLGPDVKSRKVDTVFGNYRYIRFSCNKRAHLSDTDIGEWTNVAARF